MIAIAIATLPHKYISWCRSCVAIFRSRRTGINQYVKIDAKIQFVAV